jgi:hypothetical protein
MEPALTAPMIADTLAKCLIVSLIFLSRMRRSVMTMIEQMLSFVFFHRGHQSDTRPVA